MQGLGQFESGVECLGKIQVGLKVYHSFNDNGARVSQTKTWLVLTAGLDRLQIPKFGA